MVADAHGFASWAALRRHVAALHERGEPFARAYRAIEAHDLDALRGAARPLPRARRRARHQRQRPARHGGRGVRRAARRSAARPRRRPRRGNAHGWTALHQAAYSNLPPLAQMLLDAGAPLDVSARGDGGTPLVVALFWGNREVAELLAEHGLHPATCARRRARPLELIEELVARRPPAPAARTAGSTARTAASRPGSRPTPRRRSLDEALAWAARNDRVEALDLLVARGARSTADVYRGSALTLGGGAAGASPPSGGCSRSAPTRTGADDFGGPATARA